MYVGSMTILQSVMQLIVVPITGFTQGIQPIISYNFGAGKFDRVKKTYRIAISLTLSLIHISSQPQISKLIASLEAELGVRLFDRVGRGLRISEHGQLFCQYAEEALASMQSAKMAMKNLRNSILGTVRIGTFAFAPILNPCLLAYTKKEPNVNFCYIQRSLSSLKRDIDILLTCLLYTSRCV